MLIYDKHPFSCQSALGDNLPIPQGWLLNKGSTLPPPPPPPKLTLDKGKKLTLTCTIFPFYYFIKLQFICIFVIKVLISQKPVSSRPIDTHFWKKYKKNSLNLLWENMPSGQCLAKSLFVMHCSYVHVRPLMLWSIVLSATTQNLKFQWLLIGSGRPKVVFSVKKSQHIDLLKVNSLIAQGVSKRLCP